MSRRGMILAVLVSALITLCLRALPFLVFRRGRKMPRRLTELGKILPSAIMAVLVVYCMKDVVTDFGAWGVPELAAALTVAASYRWKHNTLLSILLGTVCNMLLLRLL